MGEHGGRRTGWEGRYSQEKLAWWQEVGRAGGPAQRMGPGAPEGQPGPPGVEAWTGGGPTTVGTVGISETRFGGAEGASKMIKEC